MQLCKRIAKGHHFFPNGVIGDENDLKGMMMVVEIGLEIEVIDDDGD
jgi:hypothetical protein